MDQAKTDSSIHSLEDLRVRLARKYPHRDAFFTALLFGMCTKKPPSKLASGVDLKNGIYNPQILNRKDSCHGFVFCLLETLCKCVGVALR